jgi:hypothetical protein
MRCPSRRPRPSAQLPTGMRRPSRRPRPSHAQRAVASHRRAPTASPQGHEPRASPQGHRPRASPRGHRPPAASGRHTYGHGARSPTRALSVMRAHGSSAFAYRSAVGVKLKVSKSPRRARGESSGESTVYAKRRPRRPRRADRTETGRRAATRARSAWPRGIRDRVDAVNRRSLCGRVRCELRFRLHDCMVCCMMAAYRYHIPVYSGRSL